MNAFMFRNRAAVRRMGYGIVVGTSVALMVVTGLVWRTAQNKLDDIAALEATITRAQQVQARTTTQGTGVSFYESDTPQLAQSQMQSDMQALADENSVRLEVIRADQIEQVGSQVRMALTLNGVVPENQLGGYLRGLADHEPMIVVDTVNLRRARSSGRGNDERLLAIQLKLSGFATQ